MDNDTLQKTAKRKLEELNLIDDFLFGKMLEDPDVGQDFARIILRILFNRTFDKLTIIPQKTYFGTDTDKHGARLDVFIEGSISDENFPGTATVYDIEPEKLKDLQTKLSLPKRTRFYHAKIDSDSLQSGTDYSSLKNVVVVIILPYDPFDQDHMVYTVRNKIEELPDVNYDDGARTIFLYTKGKKGNPSRELQEFLRYMEHTTNENASNETLQDLHEMVRKVKRNKGVSLEFMKYFEQEQAWLREGREQGRKLERQNTERERQRADAAEAEITRLKSQLAELQMK